jgi:hypothetical protein
MSIMSGHPTIFYPINCRSVDREFREHRHTGLYDAKSRIPESLMPCPKIKAA